MAILYMTITLLLVLASVNLGHAAEAASDAAVPKNSTKFSEPDCPVCFRVLRASNDLSKKQSISPGTALDRYCSIDTLSVEDSKFCYNIASVKTEVYRLLELRSDVHRVCRKVNTLNSDFCRIKIPKMTTPSGIHVNDRMKRGVIYI